MDKIEFMRLWDLYQGLLTPTQQEITDLYFNKDLSLTEIAEEKGITKQAVSDCLTKCKKEFLALEEKLGFKKMLASFSAEAGRWADEFLRLHPEYVADIAALREILFKNQVG